MSRTRAPSFAARTFAAAVLMMMGGAPGVQAQAVHSQEGVFMPAQAPAHEPEPVLSEVPALTGRLVRVDTGRTVQTMARIVSIHDGDLFATVGGRPQMFPFYGIERVSIEGDSLRNGALIGSAIGVLWGVLSWQGMPCSDCTGRAIGQLLHGVGAGMGIGIWIDKKHVGRTTVYSRSQGFHGDWRKPSGR